MTQSDLITTLDNGLRVVLRPVHAAPVISLWVGYKIGSRNEQTGQTGISHWVEHMLFKGTDTFPIGVLDREIDRAGGQWNAFTSMDYTMYYATMPADRIGIALEAEADRMANALFDSEETESERTVVISERKGSENDPMFWLSEEMQAAAFRVHGYHHTIIGDSIDLETMTRDDLYAHYQRYYTPSNAVIVVVGAFDSAEMLADIKKHFGHLESQPQPTAFVRPEPTQQGERRVTVERPGMTAFLSMAHRVPACTERNWFALEVLNSVLTGAGGSIDNKTARLYKTLVKSGIAASIDGDLSESIDPYLYEITVTLNDGYTHADAETVILKEIAYMQEHGISEAELNKAKKQAKAAFAYSSESVTNQAYWLAHSHIIEDPQWYDDFLERLGAVTIEDVQRVAQTYLSARNRITGWLVPIMLDDDDDYDMYDEADETEAEVAQ